MADEHYLLLFADDPVGLEREIEYYLQMGKIGTEQNALGNPSHRGVGRYEGNWETAMKVSLSISQSGRKEGECRILDRIERIVEKGGGNWHTFEYDNKFKGPNHTSQT